MVQQLGELSLLVKHDLNTPELIKKSLEILKTKNATKEMKAQEARLRVREHKLNNTLHEVSKALTKLESKEERLDKIIERASVATASLEEQAKQKKRFGIF